MQSMGEVWEGAVGAPSHGNRRVALTARAPDSKSGGWGFESLHACQIAVGTASEGERSQESMEFLGRVQQFFREVAAEFRRVNWPSRAEVARSTLVVLAVVVILALYLGAVDVALARIVGVILK